VGWMAAGLALGLLVAGPARAYDPDYSPEVNAVADCAWNARMRYAMEHPECGVEVGPENSGWYDFAAGMLGVSQDPQVACERMFSSTLHMVESEGMRALSGTPCN